MALTEAEQRELDELELAELEAEAAAYSGDETDYFGKAFNFLDVERTPVSAMLAKALGVQRPEDPSPKDVASLNREYPNTAEIMERAGVLSGDPYFSQSILGMVGDTLSSPSTYLTGGASALAKYGSKSAKYGAKALKALETVIAPLSVASEYGMDKLGKNLWKKGFSKIDAAAMKAGKDIVPSDILTNENIYGFTAKNLGEQIDASQARRMAKRDAILDMGIAPGKTPDIDSVLSPMEEYGKGLLASVQPDVQKQGMDILDEARMVRENILGTPDKIVKGKPGKTIKGTQDLATGAYSPDIVIPAGKPKVIPGKPTQSMPPSRFQKEKVWARDKLSQGDFMNKTKIGKQSDILLSHGFQKEAERLSHDPGAIARLNAEWGAIHSGAKPQVADIAKELTTSAIDAGDMASAATYMALTGKVSPWMMARSVGGSIGLNPAISGIGALTHKAGTQFIPKTIKRTATRTPWSLMRNEDVE